MKPTTYMNLSGEAVGEAARFYKIPPDRVLVISDDVSLPQGKLRVRRSGSAGGHNGLKNIIAHLGTDQFPRIKVGVGGKPHPDSDMADWSSASLPAPTAGHGGRHRPGRRRGDLSAVPRGGPGHGPVQRLIPQSAAPFVGAILPEKTAHPHRPRRWGRPVVGPYAHPPLFLP